MAIQQMKTTHMTQISAQKPRDLEIVKLKVKAEAMLSGEHFFYQWRAGSSQVLGISIEGAMILARNWRNCVAEMVRVENQIDSTVYYASFVDFESNFSLSRAHKIPNNFIIHGKYDEWRKEIMRFEIGQSKAIRNVILAALPEWLKELALKTAMEGVKERIQKEIDKGSIVTVIDRLINVLAGHGVSEDAILEKFNIKNKKQLTVDELTIMYGDLQTIIKGGEFSENLYPIKQTESDKTKEKISKKVDEIKKKKAEKTDKSEQKQEINESEKPKETEKADTESVSKSTSESESAPDAKTVFENEWKVATSADRLNFYIKIKGIFNLIRYCEDEKIKLVDKNGNPSKNFSDLKINDQIKILWLLHRANNLTR
jgi:hypothetical protein